MSEYGGQKVFQVANETTAKIGTQRHETVDRDNGVSFSKEDGEREEKTNIMVFPNLRTV